MSTHVRRHRSIVAQAEALLAGGQAAEALRLLSVAHRANPGNAAILALNGQALCALGQYQAGIGAFMLALQHHPDDAAAHARLPAPMIKLGDLPGALHHAAQAFQLAPGSRHAAVLSGVLLTMGEYAQALVFAEAALEFSPEDPVALINQALALDGLGQHTQALTAGARAIAAAPGNPLARYHQGERLLGAGAMTREAWALYDARIAVNGFKPTPGFAVWAGEDIAGKTLLLHAEQGLGDTLQFVRYAPFAAARAGRVILAVQPPLVRLLQGTPGIDDVVEACPNPVPFDVVCPLVSLPGLAATTLGTIPLPLPYTATFQPWVDDAEGLRVGLVWAGNPGFVHDARRSVPPDDLATLAGIDGVQFYSLQQHRGLPVLPAGLGAIDLMHGVEDFHDTATCIAGLDLVICVDTAVAHLAATMNKQVWLLSRHRGCWRWLHEGAGTPWYPTMRIYRQTQPGDWNGVLHRVREDLAALARQARPRRTGPQRAAGPGTLACKACGGAATPIGSVDFTKSCEDHRRPPLPSAGRKVTYHRCPACALVFTAAFDCWTHDDFRREIYNEAYAEVDPDYATDRPAASAALVASIFGPDCRGMAVLDYGGGNGALATVLARDHGMHAVSYDPFNAETGALPARSFPLVTCFEVLEHTPDPRATIQALAAAAGPDGVVLFSTLLQPPDFPSQGVAWWYLAPRNGHITLLSRAALHALWAEQGFQLVSQGDIFHMAARALPPQATRFAQSLSPPSPPSGRGRA